MARTSAASVSMGKSEDQGIGADQYPNTLTAYFVYQRVLSSGGFVLGPVQTPIFNLKFAGWEFDRKGDQRNFLISPVFTVPIRLSPASSDQSNPA